MPFFYLQAKTAVFFSVNGIMNIVIETGYNWKSYASNHITSKIMLGNAEREQEWKHHFSGVENKDTW